MASTCKDIRSEFIAFFEKRGHTFVPSSSLLPADDPTLLFANAGMNQFKDIFLGREKRPYTRAANTQKCIRAGGKHNDLEDVGHDTYHHTFFEMLGNWSFGDYFKADAIKWAWELLTDVWGLPKERLHATVFGGDQSEGLAADDEAADLWRTVTDIDPTHIHKGSKKDNFWEMGDTGPCGPCSEIHIDLTDDLSGAAMVNAGDRRVMEIWNLVFMQFNRGLDGKLSPLPATHVDTGMGLERVGMVLQGKQSNYATDLFVPIIEKLETLTDHRYGAASGLSDRFDVVTQDDIGDVACRVIADHARSLIFAIADGIIPSNEGRGYVLRRILRRAARYGRQYLNIKGPFLVQLVPTVIEAMGDVFTELRSRQDYVTQTIREEEESFGRTLDRGIDLFQRQAEKLAQGGQKQLPGDIAFDLYATYGFPVDLTQVMAAECGMTVDVDGYDSAMARHREASSAGGEQFKVHAVAGLPSTDDQYKYSRQSVPATVLGWVRDGNYEQGGALRAGDQAAVVLDKTNFYGESGGQVGDAGHLTWPGGKFAVRDAQLAGDCVLHAGVVEEGELHAGATVTCEVDPSRMDTMRNHTATHLLNWALRLVLGDHIHQAGSVVSPDRLRFDFSHNQALTAEQIAQVETLVNRRILADEVVTAVLAPLADAKKIPGVRAVFGEKYPDPVRVIAVGTSDPLTQTGPDTPVEFCGGTHLSRTSQAGVFKILTEESVAKGVRRITAVTGSEAVARFQQSEALLHQAALVLRTSPSELPERIAAMQKEIKELRKRPAGGGAGEAFQPQVKIDSPDGEVLIGRLDAPVEAMRSECDRLRQKGAAAIFLGGVQEDKVTLVAMVADAVAKKGSLKAGDWVKAIAPVVGGGGGGKPTLAQAGGKQPEQLAAALEAAEGWVRQRV
ncbi:MAG: Alanine--tRNA ligase [Planctomycetes bacterium ADurb.Bin126]|nr:MAG: Alanine--tRNA ligase [Planctomycetes bacterium ADurb.Bin126]HOD83907.1 alanine--tRNA ligase [Phycisphaerae bacterium]HQL75480.1 alanine--tRNA ligase [Phycisphaerae bacterium]